jgi:transposase
MSDLTIITLAELVDDLERTRIANDNRIGALERSFGSALPHLYVISENLRSVERQADLELRRAWRKHPLAPWAKEVSGLGERSMARLIAVIGDPAERPNPAKLWAYCGHGAPFRSKIRKGASQADLLARGNPEAKKRVWLIATQFVRNQKSPYRVVYDAARERYDDRVHESPCVRCGPSGSPALAGSPWSLGHQHAAAIRLVGKRFLLDLWKEAKRQGAAA